MMMMTVVMIVLNDGGDDDDTTALRLHAGAGSDNTAVSEIQTRQGKARQGEATNAQSVCVSGSVTACGLA